MRKYVEPNIDDSSVTTFDQIVHILAHVCEISIFVWLGFVIGDIDWKNNCDWLVIAWVNLFCLLFRFIVTFGLTGVLNIFRKQKIDMKGQVVLSFGGLRGGIAFSLMALAGIEDKRLKEVLVIAVISVIGWTVFVQGILIEPLLNVLEIPRENLGGTKENFKYNKFDRLFLKKPILLKSARIPNEPVSSPYL